MPMMGKAHEGVGPNGEHTIKVEATNDVAYDYTFLDGDENKGCFDVNNVWLAEKLREYGRCVAVVDARVWENYGSSMREYFAQHELGLEVLPLGIDEEQKSLRTVEEAMVFFADVGVMRRETPLVIGGGLITDIVGTACALYRRSTGYLRLPTTLIGMIDASVAIKVGGNLADKHKNRIGAFHPHSGVVIDFSFLKTLPEAHIRNGVAELIKISTVEQRECFELLEAHCEDLIKYKFGYSDDAPAGLRSIGRTIARKAVLRMLELEAPNLHEHDQHRAIAYGHTWSPAYELTPKPVPMHHGHAISTDMCFSATWAAEEGWITTELRDRVHGVFAKCGLTLYHPCFTADKLHYGTKAILQRRDGDLYAAIPDNQIGACKYIKVGDFESRAAMDASLEKALGVHQRLMLARFGESQGVGKECYITEGLARKAKKAEFAGTLAGQLLDMVSGLESSQSFETVRDTAGDLRAWWQSLPAAARESLVQPSGKGHVAELPGRALFQPGNLGALQLKNRVVYPAMTRGRCPGRVINEENIKYYQQRAGAGLIVTEASSVSEAANGFVDSPGMYTAEQGAAWSSLTSALHDAGCTVVSQLWHTGRMSHSSFGSQPVCASALPITSGTVPSCGVMRADGVWAEHETPRELTAEEVEGVIEDFGLAAARAMQAGFDGVEIHAASGYLLDTFLQSCSNQRTDQYGGDWEGRFALLGAIVERVKREMPGARIGVKLSPNSGFNGMGSADNGDFVHFARRLGELGVAYLHVQDGIGTNAEASWYGKVTTDGFHGQCAPVTLEQLRQVFPRGIIANGGYTAETAGACVEKALATCVSFGRAYLGNPDLAERIQQGTPLAAAPPMDAWFEPSDKTRSDLSWGYTVTDVSGHVAELPGRALFQPGNLGELQLKNRVVYPAMTRGRCPGRVINEENIKYYQQRAGAGLIVTEASSVSEAANGFVDSPGMYTAEQGAAWSSLTSALHDAGCTVVSQLWHTGRMSHSSFGSQPVCASALPITSGTVPACGVMRADGVWAEHETPRELTTEEVEGVIEDFGLAAARAVQAGFDGVEIHAASGYLLDTFLQSCSNQRTDQYGGGWEGRFALLGAIVERVKREMPGARIGVKLSPNSGFNGMGSADNGDFVHFARRLGELGVAYLHVQDGIGTNAEASWYGKITTDGFHGQCAPVTLEQLRQVFPRGIIANGGYTAETAGACVEKALATCVSFGRAYLGNPDLAERIQQGTPLAAPPPTAAWFEPSDKTRSDLSWGYTDVSGRVF